MSRAGSGSKDSLGARFAGHIRERQLIRPGDKVLVALSGGLDSTVLLHLLRFVSGLPGQTLCAAHFDHGMRAGSLDDLHWVRGLCRAWGVDLRAGRVARSPASEDEAREERYAFLLNTMAEENAACLVTGHHSDDQVETVLFRILRGTGLRGLAGIPESRPPGITRPLLPFSKRELLVYAKRNRVPHRVDPTNRDTTYSRNFIRHDILPILDEGPIPGARDAVRRLARIAGENEEAWKSLLPELLEGVRKTEKGVVFIVRSGFLAYHPALQIRLLREIFRESGIDLGEVGTRGVLEFTRTGESGRGYSLPGGFRLSREFEVLRLHRPDEGDTSEAQVLVVPDREGGSGILRLGGKELEVTWGPVRPVGSVDLLEIPRSDLAFPLRFRAWAAGDRIELPYGTKKLKKLFGEAKIPVEERSRIPVLIDSHGRILWVAGLASSVLVAASAGTEAFFVGIRNVDQG